jgi:hypothetical protein
MENHSTLLCNTWVLHRNFTSVCWKYCCLFLSGYVFCNKLSTFEYKQPIGFTWRYESIFLVHQTLQLSGTNLYAPSKMGKFAWKSWHCSVWSCKLFQVMYVIRSAGRYEFSRRQPATAPSLPTQPTPHCCLTSKLLPYPGNFKWNAIQILPRNIEFMIHEGRM